MGPRERDRLWDRHILNSAAVGELLSGVRVWQMSEVVPGCPGSRWRSPGLTCRLS